MKDIKVLCQEQGYNAEITAFLDGVWQTIKADEAAFSAFAEQIDIYVNNMTDFDHLSMLDKVHEIGEAIGVQPGTMELVLVMYMLPILKEQYEKQGVPMQYYDAVVRVFRGSAERSFDNGGVAMSTTWWNMAYFKLNMFYIGRLIFKWQPFKESYTIGDREIKAGTYRIEVHIPRGGPLDLVSVHAAYDEAKEFFEARYNQKDPLFSCSSWTLAPMLDDILPPTSNILKFAHEYTVVKTRIDLTGERAGHYIFGNGVDMTNVDALPEDSTLRRGIKARLKAGKGIESALGIMLPKE